MKKPFRSIIFKYFISYMAIFVLAAAFSIFLYSDLSSSMKNEILSANEAMLENMRVQIDGNLEEINQLSTQISLDSDVRSLISVKGEFSEQNYYDLYKVASYLSNLVMVSSNIDNINIYLYDSGTVLSNSGHADLSMYYQLNIEKTKGLDFSLEELEALFTQRQVHSITELYSQEGCEYLLFMNDIFFPSYSNTSATVFILVDTDKIMKALENMRWNENNVVLMTDKDNNVICSTASGFSGELALSDGELHTGMDGIEYVVSLVESQSSDWKYVILTPETIFYKEVLDAQKLFFVGIVVCGMLCMFAASILAKRHYRPIEDILSVLRHKKSYNNDKNEYIWIKETVQSFLEENENVEAAFSRNRLMMKNSIMRGLLFGSYRPSPNREDGIGLNIESGRFAVVLFQSQMTPELASFDRSNNGILLFIMVNVLSEIFSKHLQAEVCELEPYAAAIIEIPDSDETNCLEIVEELVYAGKQELKERFNMEVYTALGEVHNGAQGIRKSYFEAKEALEYGVAQNNTGIAVHFNEIENRQNTYYYPFEVESKLLNALKAGNNESSAAIISEVLSRNLIGNVISPQMKKYLVSDIISSFFKALEESGNLQVSKSLELGEGIYENMPAQELEDRLLQMAELVCANSKKLVESEKSDDLSKEVIAFIEENYSDNNLNVSMIGDRFKLTPAYISKLFKEQTGEGLLNYISSVRVEEAKRLLERGMNVAEVAEHTGFTNAGGMIRTFKKLTGVTPGQMKKLMEG